MRMPVAGTDAIYGLASGGSFVRLPYDGSSPTESRFGEYTLGITSTANSEPCFLTFEDLSARLYVTCRMGPKKVLEPGDTDDAIEWWLSPHIDLVRKLSADEKDWRDDDFEDPLALMVDGDVLFVLTDQRLLSIKKGTREWKEIKIKNIPKYVQSGHSVSLALGNGTIWYGDDEGEFGGNLMRIDERTGEIHPIADVENVTGMVRDQNRADCILVAVGLAHFVGNGAILRMCGDKTESVYKGDMPVWGLFVADGTTYALLRVGVVPMKDGKFDYSLEKKFKDIGETLKLNDIPVSQFGDVFFVYSGARGSDSVGGAGSPIVVTPPPGAKLALTSDSPDHH
jgi:hypothetical protein